MIYTTKNRLGDYKGISKNLDTAIDYLLHLDTARLQKGRNEIDGDEVFANHFSYDTLPEEKCAFEEHLQYLDAHVLLSGKEKIGVSYNEHLREVSRNEEEDFIGCEGETETYFSMDTETILIVWPGESHKVKIAADGTCFVDKLVVKIKI